jgi:hypothetical protein
VERNNLFPVFLKLEALQTLIVGGGHVGLEKLNAILKNSPSATYRSFDQQRDQRTRFKTHHG